MTKDMTQGSPMKLILGFSVPLFFGFLFQQFYNLVDTIIVGRFLGVDDLAAVGSTGCINFLVIGFCMGVCNGFSIPVSHKFGAGDFVGLRKYAANCVWLGIAFSVVMTAVTTFLCRDILVLMRTPENILEGAYHYIWVIFLGIPTVYLYNIVSGVIRALGDSKTPVIFLILSSVINIALDLFFILNLKMGVAGAAWATVIAQGVSGIACLLYMIKKFEILHIRKEEWAPDRHMMMVLCGMGVPMGLQYSITAIGSVILQSAANTLGSQAVAAMTAAGKIGNFLACPFDALGSTMATYGGQNVGAGKLDRLGKGLKSCILLGAGYSVIALLTAVFGGGPLGMLFVESAETGIIGNIKLFLVINTAFYFPLALVNIVRFMIQGMGFPTFAILAGVFEMIARAIAGFLLVPVFGFLGVCLGSPIAWVFADAFLIPAYFHVRKVLERRRKIENEQINP
ncbi:MAG: MATE family efflux transporter [Lachnospiraceae bacterium]|nr:MATE family efflux transporter [Lachnospiraceae bacterium]